MPVIRLFRPLFRALAYPARLGLLLVLLIFCLSGRIVMAQKPVKINLVSANALVYNKNLGEDLRRVLGNVAFEHEGTMLYCDSAYFYELSNSLKAYGHVHIHVSDTLNIYGDTLSYDGNSRMADMSGKVKLVDKQTILTTNRLFYDRNLEVCYYFDGGKITGNENRLTSRKGYYYTSSKEFFFKEKVLLVNPRYTMNSDSLLYNTLSRIAYFKGPCHIKSNDNYIYCENGWYNTINDRSQFNQNAFLRNRDQRLSGDSLSYDRVLGVGRAFQNVTLYDSTKNILIKGNRGDYHERAGYAWITDSVMAILAENADSLYLHSDTLYATFDSLQNTKRLFSYHKVKFFRKLLQGKADSLIYSVLDSTLRLYSSPVLWSEQNQLTADSITLWMTNQEADSMMLYNNGFIISLSDTGQFNQVKGKGLLGYFRHNEVYKVRVLSNAETLYFVKEDDGSLIGVNFAESSEMEIFFREKKIVKINYLSQPEAVMHPIKELSKQELTLKGFRWHQKDRPAGKYDIFRQ